MTTPQDAMTTRLITIAGAPVEASVLNTSAFAAAILDLAAPRPLRRIPSGTKRRRSLSTTHHQDPSADANDTHSQLTLEESRDAAEVSIPAAPAWCPALPHASVPGPLVEWLLDEWLPPAASSVDDATWLRCCDSVALSSDDTLEPENHISPPVPPCVDGFLAAFAALRPRAFSVALRHVRATEKAAASLARIQSIRDLTIDNASSMFIAGLSDNIARMSNLRAIHITGGGAMHTTATRQEGIALPEALAVGLGRLPSLRAVHIAQRAVTATAASAIAASPSLTRVELWGCDVSDDAVTALTECKTLAVLGLAASPRLTSAIAAPTASLPALIDLDLSRTAVPTAEALRIITQRCPAIGTLSLSHTDLTDAAVSIIARHLHSLKTLHCVGCDLITDAGIAALAPSADTLKTLCVSGRRLTDAVGGALSGLPRLTALDLSGGGVTAGVVDGLSQCEKLRSIACGFAVTDTALRSVASKCPALTSLSADNASLVTSHGTAALARGCPSLSTLRLHGMTVTAEALAPFVQCPDLAVLDLTDGDVVDATAVAVLPALATLESIDVTCALFDDAIVPPLSQCRRLRHVSLYGSCVSQAGTDYLRAACPRLTIGHHFTPSPACSPPLSSSLACSVERDAPPSLVAVADC